MQRRPFRRTCVLLAVVLLVAGIAVPAAAAPSRTAIARPVALRHEGDDLLLMLMDALRAPFQFWHELGTGRGLSIDPNGSLKNGGSWDPNGAPNTTSAPEGPMVDEGGSVDPNGKK